MKGRVLRIIAILPYALDLAHYAMLPWMYKFHKLHIYSEEPSIHASSFFAMYVFASLLLGLVLYYLVEKPFLLIKNKF